VKNWPQIGRVAGDGLIGAENMQRSINSALRTVALKKKQEKNYAGKCKDDGRFYTDILYTGYAGEGIDPPTTSMRLNQ